MGLIGRDCCDDIKERVSGDNQDELGIHLIWIWRQGIHLNNGTEAGRCCYYHLDYHFMHYSIPNDFIVPEVKSALNIVKSFQNCRLTIFKLVLVNISKYQRC